MELQIWNNNTAIGLYCGFIFQKNMIHIQHLLHLFILKMTTRNVSNGLIPSVKPIGVSTMSQQ